MSFEIFLISTFYFLGELAKVSINLDSDLIDPALLESSFHY